MIPVIWSLSAFIILNSGAGGTQAWFWNRVDSRPFDLRLAEVKESSRIEYPVRVKSGLDPIHDGPVGPGLAPDLEFRLPSGWCMSDADGAARFSGQFCQLGNMIQGRFQIQIMT